MRKREKGMIVLNFKLVLSLRFCFRLASLPENYEKTVMILKRALLASSILSSFKNVLKLFSLSDIVLGTEDKLVNNISILLVLVQFGEKIS